MTDTFLTVDEASQALSAKQFSPTELITKMFRKMEQSEGSINAITEQFHETAYAAAKESERRFVMGKPRPLEGIPILIKDEQPIKGELNQDGSLLLKGHRADVSHPIVGRIREAGAIVLGRTTTPEFCCAPVTHSKLWGVTRNPFNSDYSPGGSSGGSGAALAAGYSILATGSDIGGSIRIPASYCGVVGYKPPFGRVPGLPPYNSDTYCADGPMGRSVKDVAQLQNIIAGPWSNDPASLRSHLSLTPQIQDLSGIRIALSYELGDYAPETDVITNTQAVAEALRTAGATVEEVKLPWNKAEIIDIAWAHFAAIMGSSINDLANNASAGRDLLMPYTKAFVGHTENTIPFAEGLVKETELYRPFGELLEHYDALICPTIANTGLRADETCSDIETLFSSIMTLPFNVLGRVPVLAIPSGIASNGIPTGVQIVGKTYDDSTVFNVGITVEKILELWTQQEWWPKW